MAQENLTDPVERHEITGKHLIIIPGTNVADVARKLFTFWGPGSKLFADKRVMYFLHPVSDSVTQVVQTLQETGFHELGTPIVVTALGRQYEIDIQYRAYRPVDRPLEDLAKYCNA